MEQDKFDQAAYLAPLTGIRGVAALYVLIMHLNMTYDGINLLDFLPVIGKGYLGVDLFFVLSGFIISHVYTSHFEVFSWHSWGDFMWNRFARIYPIHLFTIIVLLLMIVGAGLVGIRPNDPSNWRYDQLPWQLLLMHAWGTIETPTWNAPSWSISAEWCAYILFPVILAFARRLSVRRLRFSSSVR